MSVPVRKAVMPVAGLGTRFLPATKATPKEMLPVVDKPAIQYVVEEAVEAGINDVLFVTGRAKYGLEDHFDRLPFLEQALEAKGDHERLRQVREVADLADVHYVRQGEPLGLGHAVLMAALHIGNEPFSVLLGDDIIDRRNPVLTRMLNARERFGGSVLCLMEVDPEHIHMYGCAAVEATDDPEVVRVTDLVEKPDPGTAPSNFAVIGRYVLDPRIFTELERTKPGRGGEIQLTDALRRLVVDVPHGEGGGVVGIVFKGRRYDTGDTLSYVQAVVQIAADRDDLGPKFRQWLRETVTQWES
jgi:UTP--glucose-1-phosphate uridylyltransferase